MKKWITATALVTLLVVVACSLQNYIASPSVDSSGRYSYLLVAPPGSTPTATPFQPIPPTPMNLPVTTQANNRPVQDETPQPEIQFTPGEGRSWDDYAGPIIWPDIEIPAPIGVLTHPEGQINILLLGSDQRPNDGGFRTDTIQLLTINPQEKTVKLTAFPRDLYVYIPGYTIQRINVAMGWGGFDALATTMEYNFGVRPQYYVLINFWSFEDMIDSLGGIRVEIGRDFCDHRDGYDNFCVSQGTMWMNGETALWYVRARYSTSDLDRGRRQQEVLKALFNQMISIDGLHRVPELYDIYKNNVTTNLTLDYASQFLSLAARIASSQGIQSYSIGAGEIYNWVTSGGAMVLVPYREQVLEKMRHVISEP